MSKNVLNYQNQLKIAVSWYIWYISDLTLLDFTYNGTLYNLPVDKPFSNGELTTGISQYKDQVYPFPLKFAIAEAILYCGSKYLHLSQIIEEYNMTVVAVKHSEPQAWLCFNFIDAQNNPIPRCLS